MNRAILTPRLTRLIQEFAQMAMESRQVGRRLRDLLPRRYREIRSELGRLHKGAHGDRMALVDPRYVQALEELHEVVDRAVTARIQYETHMMLFQARQSLRRQRF